MSSEIKKFQDVLNFQFNNFDLLIEALTHRSYINENKEEDTSNNERLEFIGDAVLELVTTEYLFHKYPNKPEGDLTSFRSALVRTESLAEESTKLGVGEFIRMSKGEESTGGRERSYILANTFEAITGAIYLDQGYDKAREYLMSTVLKKTEEIVENRLDIDPKSKLQEMSQEIIKETPSYKLKSSTGPDHSKTFTMCLVINDIELTTGKGKSKQEAEQNAAKAALDSWQEIEEKLSDS
ncbi:MAG: ribonuclease III [Candidatus Dojkabacteria bacterium]|nr:ribonuclease III [Candidatus Dojkabacteria bacterium]MDQ7020449.1 ribonuclease III [Candidatus Dojkabacteria bacterium]